MYRILNVNSRELSLLPLYVAKPSPTKLISYKIKHQNYYKNTVLFLNLTIQP